MAPMAAPPILLCPNAGCILSALIKTESGACLYINGAVEATAAVSGLINTNGNDPVTIGAWINNGVLSRQWQGQIDEVRIYNRALTQSDVTQLYGFTLAGFNNAPEATTPGTLSFDAPTNVQLTAIVSDDGYPLPANPSNPAPNDPNKLRWGWSVLSQPVTSQGVVWSGNPTNGEAFTYSGSPNAPWTLFTNNPTASFDAPGMYVLQFVVSDGQKTNSQKVIVRIRSRKDYRQSGYAYLSPLPGAEYTSPQMSLVLVRFSSISPTAITNLSSFITVTGAQSGQHTGTTKIAADGQTVLFQMSSGFTANEMVTVSLSPGVPVASGGPAPPYQYQFMIAGHWADSSPKYAVASTIVATPMANVNPSPMIQTLAASNGVAGIMSNGVSVPSDFPWIVITTNNNADPDPIFIDNRGAGGDLFNVIFDNNGNPIWYSKYPDERRDMKVQHNGLMSMLARDGGNHFNVLNTHYQLVTNYWAANGYGVDEHELQVLADGTYLLVGAANGNGGHEPLYRWGQSGGFRDGTSHTGILSSRRVDHAVALLGAFRHYG